VGLGRGRAITAADSGSLHRCAALVFPRDAESSQCSPRVHRQAIRISTSEAPKESRGRMVTGLSFPRRRENQPEGLSRSPCAGTHDRLTRAVRLGQVQPGLRPIFAEGQRRTWNRCPPTHGSSRPYGQKKKSPTWMDIHRRAAARGLRLTKSPPAGNPRSDVGPLTEVCRTIRRLLYARKSASLHARLRPARSPGRCRKQQIVDRGS